MLLTPTRKQILFLFTACFSFPILADSSHSHEEHDHHHHHAINVKTTDDFVDSDVKDRPLSNWQGNWQSIYDYLIAGDLDLAFEKKAKAQQKSFADIKNYYNAGYQTDIDMITIDKNEDIHFFKQNQWLASCHYIYDGFKILTYESGNRGVRYLFHCEDKNSAAPQFVQFSDHIIEPHASSHFHLFLNNESHEQGLTQIHHFPTYYPLSYSSKDIEHDLMHH